MNNRASMLLVSILLATAAASGVAQSLPGGAGGGAGAAQGVRGGGTTGGSAGGAGGGRATSGPVVYGIGGISPEAARAKPFPAAATVPVTDFPGKMVTLKAQGVPLREAFDKLHEQSSIQFSISGNKPLEDKAVTLEMQDKTLWQTLQALLKQADPSPSLACFVRAPGARGGIRVNSTFSSSGAFLVYLNRVSHQVSATPGQPERYNVSTSVMCDGTLRLSGVQYESTAKKATDENGKSLVSSLTIARRFVPTDPSTFSYPAIIVLEPPAEGDLPKKIAVLEGTLPALFVTTEDVEVKMGEKVEKRYGQWTATVALSPWHNSADQAQVSLHYTPDAAVTDEQVADWQQQLSATIFELLDTEGKPLPTDQTTTGLARRVLSITQNYPPQPVSGPAPQPPAPTGKPGKAIVHVPTAFKAVEIPYHFADVALP